MEHFCKTGTKQVLVRYGFSDFDTYGNGNYAAAATGNLDAPDFIPQGSVYSPHTVKPQAWQTVAHRDGENRPIGAIHKPTNRKND